MWLLEWVSKTNIFWQQVSELSKKDTNQLSGGYKDFVTKETWISMQSVTHFD